MYTNAKFVGSRIISVLFFVAALLGWGLNSGLAATQSDIAFNSDDPIRYVITGGSATGYFQSVFEAINSVVRNRYPGSTVNIRPGSPAGSLLEIANGKADFAGATGSVEVIHALDAKPPFKESLDGEIFQVMTIHNGLIPHYLMSRDWADEHGIRSFQDIADKKPPMNIAVNFRANLQSTLGMYANLFEQYGFTLEDVESWGGNVLRGNAALGLDAMADGRADVFINGGFLPSARVKKLARTREILWIDADEEHLRKAAHSVNYTTGSIPEGTYDFIDKEVPIQKMWNGVQAGPHVSEETVYKFLNAVYEQQNMIRSVHSSLREFGPEMMIWNPAGLPFHPGAERFYREKGLIE
ncbi:TAXI family TRAP transporter solute-binding subunit [Marinobacter sp. TBZ242]|uniref:TAXI family TRAP transporter solute-binding subunit n=1 Tax=Marinobacter azerbaijanicus TaxID=3050455 RepID=A0ABT7IGF3_9GAMM|nr:TAXI family TRAP transporter solute-binding subunit [Marinobacter sp. TBZ242]MDL0433249.1 TAXI family TRAP transporter solute-binding subunit [Marinobacter sp. TBZ242]